MSDTLFEFEPITPVVGALASDADLTRPLGAQAVRGIRRALLDHGVVFFRKQALTRAQMLAFMKNFGEPRLDPMAADQEVPSEETITDIPTLGYRKATNYWHIDSTLAPEPASIIALRALELPPVGGDTCWGSMYAAYDALSEPIHGMIENLTAVHSGYKVNVLVRGAGHKPLQEEMQSIHPVVRVHPETGRKALFVNELWTEKIVELSPSESRCLLDLLFDHVKSPEFNMRWRWQVGDIALWDNRSFHHYAVSDYDATRVLQKSILAGDRPYGPS